MSDSDPLAELSPFIKAARDSGESFTPPVGLSERLIASRSAPVPDSELPASFGPYILEKIIGSGASGTVYQAYHAQLDRHIAVKILAPELTALPDSRERFLLEGRAAANLQHENLMPLFAVHEDTPFPCLTSPLLRGETLQQMVDREGRLPAEKVTQIARDIACALRHAHEAGIVHRDIKPSNVFFDRSANRAIVMDFGLSRALDAPSELTLSGTIVGTPEFLAPEQIDDHPELTPATDLYSLGATLYTLLSGAPPHRASSLTSLLKKVAVDAPEPLTEVPPWLSKLTFSLLAKSPGDRPDSAEQVIEILDQKASPTEARSRIPKLIWGLIAAGLLVFGASIFLKKEESADVPFSIFDELDSDSEHIVIPQKGIYKITSLNLDRDLKISASEPDTVIRFNAVDQSAITTSGNLVLENITLQIPPPDEGPTTHVIVSSGETLTLDGCRFEHLGREEVPFAQEAIILAESPLRCSIVDSEIFSFRAPLFEGSDRSELSILRSLIFSPSLLKLNRVESQKVEIEKSTAVCVSLVMVSPQCNLVQIRASESHLEAKHALLWIPNGEKDEVRKNVQWSGERNTIATARALLSFSPRRTRIRGTAADLSDFESWREFWKTDLDSREVSHYLAELGSLAQSPPVFRLEEENLKIPHQTGPERFRMSKD